MISFIEMGFYLSLAVMLCLLFLLINHLKSRIITLENQNEGMMDVMKMIRGNLVNSDKEQKQLKDSLFSLAKNVSQVSSVVNGFQQQTQSLEKNNITLEVEDLSSSFSSSLLQTKRSKSLEWTGAAGEESEEEEEDTETEERTQEVAGEDTNELEVVNIDWPSNEEEIEIHKILAEDRSEHEDPELQRKIMEMAQLQYSTPMFMHSSEASDLQKMFFMMSMGNGIPMSNLVFENTRDYTQLPEAYDDPEVEQLPDSPVPELILVESDDEELMEEKALNARIDDLIANVTSVEEVSALVPPTVEVPVLPVEEEVAEAESVSVPPTAEEERVEVAEPSSQVEETSEPLPPTVEEEVVEVAATDSMDFSKMDVRTLRSLVSTQGKVAHEKVAKMKKAELIRLLSSSSSSSSE